MRLACPTCGAVASAEAWLTDEEARLALAAIVRLPGELPRVALQYMGLFRAPGTKRGLAWRKVERLAEELAALVAEPEISWKSKGPFPCSSAHWRQGLETMLDLSGQGRLELPMESHGYLRSIVCDLANKDEAKTEARTEQARREIVRAPQATPQEYAPEHEVWTPPPGGGRGAMLRARENYEAEKRARGETPAPVDLAACIKVMPEVVVEEITPADRARLEEQKAELMRRFG